jgi:hypothetical protein
MDVSRRRLVALLGLAYPALKAAPVRDVGWTPPRPFDPERAIASLQTFRRAAIRLHPKRVYRPLPANASKMGGAFLWPASEPWPFCRESDPVPSQPPLSFEQFLLREREMKLGRGLVPPPHPSDTNDIAAWQQWNRDNQAVWKRERAKGLPELTSDEAARAKDRFAKESADWADMAAPHNEAYQPILQLRRDDFPELPWPQGKDLFQLLWCPRVHFWGNGGNRIVWRTEASVVSRLAPAPPPSKLWRIAECSFQPEDMVEYPQASDLGPDYVAAIPKLQGWFDSAGPRPKDDPGPAWRYSYDIATAPGTKLLGYPQWIQDAETPRCACGRRMTLLVTCASQEDSKSAIWNSRPARGYQDELENPSGITWGDWSNAYVFYCAATHEIRTKTVVQTS